MPRSIHPFPHIPSRINPNNRYSAKSGGGGDVQQTATRTRWIDVAEHTDGLLAHRYSAPKINLEQRARGVIRRRLNFAHNRAPGIVKHHINTPESLDGTRECRNDVVGLCNVTFYDAEALRIGIRGDEVVEVCRRAQSCNGDFPFGEDNFRERSTEAG
jgi:hypothetical protein